jgi:autotransporter-associated beta strand protein
MRNQPTTIKSGTLLRRLKSAFTAGLLPALILLLSIQTSHAGSATWLASPATGDWNTAANWTAGGPPNGSADTATFDLSNTTGVSISASTEVNGIVFNPGASAFTVSVSSTTLPQFTISGVGITNNSGITQNFATAEPPHATIAFTNSATAGSLTTYINTGGTVSGKFGGFTEFFNSSTASNATFIINGGAVSGAMGGFLQFNDTSTAGNSTITINGGAVIGATRGHFDIADIATLSNATLIANPGPGSATDLVGGIIRFFDDSTGGTARVEVFGNGAAGDTTNGNLDISFHNAPGVAIGSIEGSGAVFLGAFNLTVGGNNLSTAFSGVIQDGGQNGGTGGSVTKIGKGKLTLSKASTYTGGTTVSRGTLLVTNRTGSATGTGAVQINAGTLGGTGKISGAVTVASGTSTAFLAPGSGKKSGTLTILSALTFNFPATYKADLNSTTALADKVVALGVTINSGAQFSFTDLGAGTLTSGTVFTVINNTAATPIAGTFSNLADGSTFTVGSNTYKVSYEGGTGNDLTLTVQ